MVNLRTALCRFFFSLFLLITLPCSSPAAEKVYTLAVVPNLPPVTLHKNWKPLVNYLSKKVGARFELKLYDKINTFLDDAKDGKVDFLYAAPNLFFIAYQKQRYIPLVRSAHLIRGQVFVRKDSPYSKVNELKGKNIAFVGPKSVCSVITRHSLMTGQGAIDYNVSFSGSTINVAKSVLVGKADAGATLDTSMMNDIPEMRKEFRVILETEKMAPHPLAAHPRVPQKVRETVTTALLRLARSNKGKQMLETVKLAEPVRADYKRDYSFFSQVDFERLDKQVTK